MEERLKAMLGQLGQDAEAAWDSVVDNNGYSPAALVQVTYEHTCILLH